MPRVEVVAEEHQGCEGLRLPPPMRRYLCWPRRVARRVVVRRTLAQRPGERGRVGREAGGGIHGCFDEAVVES